MFLESVPEAMVVVENVCCGEKKEWQLEPGGGRYMGSLSVVSSQVVDRLLNNFSCGESNRVGGGKEGALEDSLGSVLTALARYLRSLATALRIVSLVVNQIEVEDRRKVLSGR